MIVESTSNSDWSCELINIKKSFLKLKPLITSLRGQGKTTNKQTLKYYCKLCVLCVANAKLCKSEEGNILEAVNLALNSEQKREEFC